MNDVFVLHYDVRPEEKKVTVVICTPHTLFNMIRCEQSDLAVGGGFGQDGMYKVFLNNSSCLITSTVVDANQHGHPVSWTITNSETKADYTEVLQALQRGSEAIALPLSEHFGIEVGMLPTVDGVYEPKNRRSVSDSASAIHGAHTDAGFQNTVCWYHLVVKLNLTYKNKFGDDFPDFKSGLDTEHSCTHKLLGELGRKFFDQEWGDRSPTAMAAFSKAWRNGKGLNAFFDGKAGDAVTNNFCEARHRVIHADMDRVRASMSSFLAPNGKQSIVTWGNNQSIEDCSKGFNKVPVYKTKDWKHAQ